MLIQVLSIDLHGVVHEFKATKYVPLLGAGRRMSTLRTSKEGGKSLCASLKSNDSLKLPVNSKCMDI